jgi:hypothetical protein
MPRKILIQDDELLKILIEKEKDKNGIDEITKKGEVLVKKSEAIKKEFDALMTEQNKIVARMARADEKAKPILEREISKIIFGEYEDFSALRLGKESEGDKPDQIGKPILIIADRMEEFKVKFNAERKSKKNNGSNPVPNERNGGSDTPHFTKRD